MNQVTGILLAVTLIVIQVDVNLLLHYVRMRVELSTRYADVVTANFSITAQGVTFSETAKPSTEAEATDSALVLCARAVEALAKACAACEKEKLPDAAKLCTEASLKIAAACKSCLKPKQLEAGRKRPCF